MGVGQCTALQLPGGVPIWAERRYSIPVTFFIWDRLASIAGILTLFQDCLGLGYVLLTGSGLPYVVLSQELSGQCFNQTKPCWHNSPEVSALSLEHRRWDVLY